jgi:DNA repair photolyase
MSASGQPLRGRGSAENPPPRFERISYEPDADAPPEEAGPPTQFLRDTARSIIAYNDSPDVGFAASINPYRGCEHGCAYCYARPNHEYLGFSAGLDFETKIVVKEDAPELLRRELAAPGWRPQTIALSGVTDPYQPGERHFRLTRRCLEVLAEFRNPVGIVTKSQLVTRDVDVLAELARHEAVGVFISLTTLDPELALRMEPRATQPAGRLAAMEILVRAGVPVGVMTAPVIPGLTDHELPALLAAAAAAGARFAGYVPLRLPHGVGPLFEAWLARHFPARQRRVMSRVRLLRGGRVNDSRFGSRMRGEGPVAEAVRKLFHLGCQKAGIRPGAPTLQTGAFRNPAHSQRTLFD